MAQSTSLEPFPPVNPGYTGVRREHDSKLHSNGVRPRRKSSGLGGELPGDSSVAAFATMSPPATPTVSRTPSERNPRSSRRKRAKGMLKRWKAISYRHTWLNPLIACLTVVSLYLLNPTPSNPLHAALFLSYPLPRDPSADPSAPIQYGKGARDFAFVAFYTVFLSFTREFLMQRVIRPLAIRAGIKSRAKQSRFMEQFYTAVYFAIFGPYGLYVMSRTPVWYFNTRGMYEGFPHRSHEALFKAYYLLQAAYWAQQMIVLLLMLEKPRKDFKELVAHHVITLSLIWLSYRFHFTYMGLAVYITHDISDFFLATSKVLNYLDSPLIGPYFFFFICIWTYARHLINLRILASIWTEFRTVGPFELNWETQQYKCWISQYITFALLACLQAVNVFWLFLILRIAWRFVRSWGDVAEDERSEYEESEAEAEAEGEVDETEDSANGETRAPEVLVNGLPAELEVGASGAVAEVREKEAPRGGSARVLRERKQRG